VNILTRLLKRHLDRTEPPLRDEDGLTVTATHGDDPEFCVDPDCRICKNLREYVPAFPELREPLGSGDVPTAVGDMCFRCHKKKVMPPAVWCDDCRPLVWGVGSEPIERQADQ
jgi:hypothetical protein